MMMGKEKGIGAIILAKRPDMKSEYEEEDEERGEALESAARDIIEGVKKGDPECIKDALKSAFEILSY